MLVGIASLMPKCIPELEVFLHEATHDCVNSTNEEKEQRTHHIDVDENHGDHSRSARLSLTIVYDVRSGANTHSDRMRK